MDETIVTFICSCCDEIRQEVEDPAMSDCCCLSCSEPTMF